MRVFDGQPEIRTRLIEDCAAARIWPIRIVARKPAAKDVQDTVVVENRAAAIRAFGVEDLIILKERAGNGAGDRKPARIAVVVKRATAAPIISRIVARGIAAEIRSRDRDRVSAAVVDRATVAQRAVFDELRIHNAELAGRVNRATVGVCLVVDETALVDLQDTLVSNGPAAAAAAIPLCEGDLVHLNIAAGIHVEDARITTAAERDWSLNDDS